MIRRLRNKRASVKDDKPEDCHVKESRGGSCDAAANGGDEQDWETETEIDCGSQGMDFFKTNKSCWEDCEFPSECIHNVISNVEADSE